MTGQPQVYLDTSAYLNILLGESSAPKLLRAVSKKILCSSVLLLIEAERNLVRLSREGTLSAADYETASKQLKKDQEFFIFRELTADLCLTGAFPPVQIPRSSDLAHLRTARWFQENGGLELFVTSDTRQKAAARDFGLPTGDV